MWTKLSQHAEELPTAFRQKRLQQEQEKGFRFKNAVQDSAEAMTRVKGESMIRLIQVSRLEMFLRICVQVKPCNKISLREMYSKYMFTTFVHEIYLHMKLKLND
jgi:hypothetical protein